MSKQALREKYTALRKALNVAEKQNKSEAITNQLLRLPIWNATYYSLFLSMDLKNEIDTEFILALLQGHDKEICVPKMTQAKDMEHILLTDNTLLKISPLGIPEPQNGLKVPTTQIEVVFIPLLAFDLKGNRIGYGKGIYDCFLKKCNPNTLKIGLSFFKAETHLIPTEPHDISLDYCVTPEQVYHF